MTSGFLFNEEQLSNFKLATMSIEDGQSKIETKTGGFSQGLLGSKYYLRGDFDIQIDCHMGFLEGKLNMDQVAFIAVHERGKEFKKINAALITIGKVGVDKAYIGSSYFKKGRQHHGKYHRINSFHGTLRLVRIANKITTLYKTVGSNEWTKINVFPYTTNDVTIAFSLLNFVHKRTSIQAELSIYAKFDNFRINAAQGIIEEEI